MGLRFALHAAVANLGVPLVELGALADPDRRGLPPLLGLVVVIRDENCQPLAGPREDVAWLRALGDLNAVTVTAS